MDFELSDDQKMLKETVASFAAKQSPISRARKMRSDEIGWSEETWKQMGELGWLAVAFPEAVGGYGGSFVDVAVILEKLGKTLVPEPFVPSVVLAGSAIALAGTEEQQQRLLGPMLEGAASLAYATEDRAETTAGTAGSDWMLSGEKNFVLNGHRADTLVVTATAPEGPSLFALPRGADGVQIEPIRLLDDRRGAIVRFEGAKAELLGSPGQAGPIIESVFDRGAAAACAEAVGICETVLEMTLEHLNLREQFGTKIGTFQVLQHRAVDMFVEVELMKSMALTAAVMVDAEDVAARQREVSAAKAQLAVSGKLVTQQSIQLHGGIGVTDEHDVGLFFKRMHLLNVMFGDEVFHLSRYMNQPSFSE